jgi:hypothetical protein
VIGFEAQRAAIAQLDCCQGPGASSSGDPLIGQRNRAAADAHAESLRAIVTPLAGQTMRAIARALNDRGIRLCAAASGKRRRSCACLTVSGFDWAGRSCSQA